MTAKLTLKLTEDEAELIVDALEADMEGYLESAGEARANRNHADVATFGEAAARIKAVMDKVQALIGDRDD